MTDWAALDFWAERQECPVCGHVGMKIDWRLTAYPLGTFSLAGSQFKVVAAEEPWIVCPDCGAEARGK